MQDRREFIIKLARGVTLATIIGVSGALILRKRDDEICNFDFVCSNCKKLKNCKLPEAKQFKHNKSPDPNNM